MGYKVLPVNCENNYYKPKFIKAVKDYAEKHNRAQEPDVVWSEISQLPLYFVLDMQSLDMIGFFTIRPLQNGVSVVHSWAHKTTPHAVKYMLQYIDEKSNGGKVFISMKHNDENFTKYFSKFGYEQSDAIFEKDFAKQVIQEEQEEPEPNLKLVEPVNA